MKLSGRKFAITGAGRGLGSALAIVLADAGATPILLGRTAKDLANTSGIIMQRTGRKVSVIACDLANSSDCRKAGKMLVEEHRDIDGLILNGAMWLPGSMSEISDEDIRTCISSASIGSMILARHVLPVLMEKEHSDIHTVVSTSGLSNLPLDGVSVAFRAAKAAQHGLVQGLSDELQNTSIRVTAIYPGDFRDISPVESAWNDSEGSKTGLSNREVTDAILFMLNMPATVTINQMVIK